MKKLPDPIDSVYPDLKARLLQVYACMKVRHKLDMRCTSGLRTWKEQDRLYEQGRTTSGKIVTYDRGGESLHNFSCAADSCFRGKDPYFDEDEVKAKWAWNQFASYCKGFGLTAGAYFHHPDRPHVEITYGLSLIDIQEIYTIGGIQALWARFDQIRSVK